MCQYCLLDIKTSVVVIEEYLLQSTRTVHEKSAFLHRLVSKAPHCFHPELWLSYLTFIVANPKSLIGPSQEATATVPFQALGAVQSSVHETQSVFELFEQALRCVPTTWEVSELYLYYLSTLTQNDMTCWTTITHETHDDLVRTIVKYVGWKLC